MAGSSGPQLLENAKSDPPIHYKGFITDGDLPSVISVISEYFKPGRVHWKAIALETQPMEELTMEEREITEAITACNQVLASIGNAKNELKSAKNWGIFDILGGGLFASLIKHNKMSHAEEAMQAIQFDLQRLQRELRDVSQALEITFSAGDLNMVFDIVFDNIFSDLISQNKIHAALDDLMELEGDVERLRERLHQLKASY